MEARDTKAAGDEETREAEAAGAFLLSSEALTHQLPSHADDLQQGGLHVLVHVALAEISKSLILHLSSAAAQLQLQADRFYFLSSRSHFNTSLTCAALSR